MKRTIGANLTKHKKVQDNHMANSKNIVAWNAVLTRCGIDASTLQVNGALPKALADKLCTDLKEWLATPHTARASSTPDLTPDELKKASKEVHDTFTKFKSESYEVSVLAAFMTATSGEDIEETKSLIKAVAKQIPTHFSIGAGASPRIRRLNDAKGKATGQVAFPPVERPAPGTERPKGLLRNDKGTKEAFEKAGYPTDGIAFAKWVAHCEANGLAKPTTDDLSAFAKGPAPVAAPSSKAAVDQSVPF